MRAPLRTLAIAFIGAVPLGLVASQVVVPNAFSNGQMADATAVNANFGALATAQNDTDTKVSGLLTPTLHLPANAAQAYSNTELQWAAGGGVFTVELDTSGSFSNPFSAQTVKQAIAMRDLRRAGLPPALGSYSWRVKATLGANTYTSATRTVSYVPDGTSCREIWEASVQTAPSGVYKIAPDGVAANAVDVYCDNATSPGGWTLIFSSQTVAGIADRAGAYSNQLATLTPSGSMLSVWTPWTTVLQTRFACDGGKSGVLAFNQADTTGQAYARFRASTTGLENFTDALGGAWTLNNSNEDPAHPDFTVRSSGTLRWGSYDDRPYATPTDDDYCNATSYQNRSTAPSLASTSNAYFYIYAR